MSSKSVSSSIPSWQILTAHAQPFRGARDLAFCLKVPLDSLLVWASSGGSGETAWMRRLAWFVAARICDKYQIRLTRPKYQDSSSNSFLCWKLKCPKLHILYWASKFTQNLIIIYLHIILFYYTKYQGPIWNTCWHHKNYQIAKDNNAVKMFVKFFIAWRVIHGWTSYFGIMNNWPHNKCRSKWPILHGPLILPYILKLFLCPPTSKKLRGHQLLWSWGAYWFGRLRLSVRYALHTVKNN